jgi:hypothetical protein
MLSLDAVAIIAIGITIVTSALGLLFQGFVLLRNKATKVDGTSARNLGCMLFWIGLITIAFGGVKLAWFGSALIILVGIGFAISYKSFVHGKR